ncbi:hypothetical protein B296_00039257 [Ensete ventricosum]|uniref:Uncharacterized protein n=1 Tax=Ensete ventricosum TaxID=4639 RepID=A0A426ZU44_ENSVE|nr:hypothetical protein B296_00039257 [Ensete ventricosum]
MGLFRVVTIEILFITTRNRSVTINFNCDRPLSGGPCTKPFLEGKEALKEQRKRTLREKEGSIEGKGRRGHSKKMEKKKDNRENLDTKPFLDLDPVLPSLDDPDPGGNGEAAARAAEEAVSFIALSTTLQLCLRRVLRRRSEMSAAFDVFVAFFAECCR